MMKMPRQVFTAQFKELAVRRVKDGGSVSSVAKELGISAQTLRNWVKAAQAGKLNGLNAGRGDARRDGAVASARRELPSHAGERNHKKNNGVLRERCAVKYAWIARHANSFALEQMCGTLGVSISGYRAWKRGGRIGRKRLSDEQLLAVIRSIHAELKGAYGSPRMVRELRARNLPASKARVERLMHDNDIRARHKRRYKATTDSRHNLPVARNRLDRNFAPSAPNRVWASDITYLRTDEGWMYLAIVLDLFNREVVGWSLDSRMSSDLVVRALETAMHRRRPKPGLLHHSDRGSQYASHAFQDKLKEFGMICSMSRKGNCAGQCPRGELVQQLQERAGARCALPNPRRDEGRQL